MRKLDTFTIVIIAVCLLAAGLLIYYAWQKLSDKEDTPDRSDLYGQGALMINGETVFTERMRLTKRGNQWYYILQLDPYAEPLIYQLKHQEENRMVFQHRTQAFPAQVVLLRHADGSFSTQLLAKEQIQLSSTQLNFLTKRNVLLVDKAVRNLVKK